MCSQGVPPTDVYYLDKTSVGPKSCDRIKPVCLAGAGLPYEDATVADNGSAADPTGKLERLLLRTEEGTPAARMRCYICLEAGGGQRQMADGI